MKSDATHTEAKSGSNSDVVIFQAHFDPFSPFLKYFFGMQQKAPYFYEPTNKVKKGLD